MERKQLDLLFLKKVSFARRAAHAQASADFELLVNASLMEFVETSVELDDIFVILKLD